MMVAPGLGIMATTAEAERSIFSLRLLAWGVAAVFLVIALKSRR